SGQAVPPTAPGVSDDVERGTRNVEPDSELETRDPEPPSSDKWPAPDLVIIDGGPGQLGAALIVMRELGVYDIPAVGLAKRHEEPNVPGETEPIVLPRGS